MGYQLGIDLGTTYTAAAVHRGGTVEIVTLGDRAASIPSVVFLKEDESILTGDAANRRALGEPDRVARQFKRRVGDPTPIMLGGTPYSAEALLAKLLRWTVDQVTALEGEPPDRIAVTHPANWGPYKTDLLGQTIRLADLENVVTLTEPEAAAIFYASNERVDPGSIIAVYDLGGGTFDAAVLRKSEDGWEILGAPEGIERLGGIDFDEAVFSHVRRGLSDEFAALNPDDPAVIDALARLRHDTIEAKEALSSDTDASIPVLLPGVQTKVRITRSEFEAMVRPTLQDTIGAMQRALRSAGVEPGDVSAVLLVGGSSRVPLVAQLVGAEFGRPVAVDAHPKHAIALGAALAASGAQDSATSVPVVVDAGDDVDRPAEGAEIEVEAEAEAGPAVEPPPPPPAPPPADGTLPPVPETTGGGRRLPLVIVGGVVALAAVVGGVLVLSGGDDDEGKGDSDTPAGQATDAPENVEGAWQALSDAPTARQQVGAAAVDGTIWIAGGLTDEGPTTKVEGYDPAIDTWKSGPDLPLAVHHAAAVTYDGELVVIGGWAPDGANPSGITSNQVFALRDGKWVELPTLKHGRAALAAAVVGDKIVVVGGQADGKLVAETEVFDGEEWADGAPMPTPREHLAAAADGGFLYAVGGRALSSDANSPALERYDPEEDAWEDLPDMPTARGGLGAAVIEGRLIALGGEDPASVHDAVEAFNLATSKWETLSAMRTPRHGLGVVAIASSLYAVVGAGKPTHAASSAFNEVLVVTASEGGGEAVGESERPEGPYVEISEVESTDERYVFTFDAFEFTPVSDDPGAFHIHFFWDTLPRINAGTNGPDPGDWLLWDTPFTVDDPFFDLANTPEGARAICGVIVDNNHAVADVDADGTIDSDTGNCADLPEG